VQLPKNAQKPQFAVNPNPVIDLVDDDGAILRALSRLLRAHGFVVRAFVSGPEFLSSVALSPPDCVILDVQMPGMSGLDLYGRLRAMAIDLPVIFITAHENPEAEQFATSGGAVAFLYKPLRAHTLCAAIRSALGRKGGS